MTTVQLDYTPPSWSSRPTSNYYLEVLKNGILLEKKSIFQKAMYLIGKQIEVCDIVLDNPSVSRRHAVIQSKNTNEIFLYDLGSTHGTTVNNLAVTSRLFHKLNIFDQIRFGQSNRIYVLRCEKLEEEDGVKQDQLIYEKDKEKRRLKQEFRSLKDQYINLLQRDPQYGFMKAKPQIKKGEQEDEGISWGMIDEQEIYRYQQEQEYPLEPDLLKQLNFSENQLEKIKHYDEKLTKFRQIEGELDELLVKERNNFGLEEGLKKKKEKLQNKQMEFGTELDGADENLRFILFGDKTHSNRLMQKKPEVDSSEDDEYYDNTLANQKKKKNKLDEENHQQIKQESTDIEQTTQKFSEIKKHLGDLLEQREKLHQQLINLKSQSDQQSKDQEDPLDAFMSQTVLNLFEESRPKLLAQIQKLTQEIETDQELLKKVRPESDITKEIFEQKEVFVTSQPKDPIEVQNQSQKSVISSTLAKLKEISQKKIVQEDDEEQILEQARQHFKKEQEKQARLDKEIENQAKRKQRQEQMKLDEDYQQPKKKIQTVAAKPSSRHTKMTEVETEDNIVDITKFL